MNEKTKRRRNKNNTNNEQNETEETQNDNRMKEYNSINPEKPNDNDIPKIKNYYQERLEYILKLKEENNLEELLALADKSLKRKLQLETEEYQIKLQNDNLIKENAILKDIFQDVNKKYSDKEKVAKMIIDKIQLINEEKNKIILEESEKRSKCVKETEEFVKDLQNKYQAEIPEKQKLLEENQILRKDIEKCVEETIKMKDAIEKQMKEKEQRAFYLENEYKNDIKTKMEVMTTTAQKYLLENSALKSEIINYQKRNQELGNSLLMFKTEYEKVVNEIERKKEDILLLAKDNVILKEKIRKLKKDEVIREYEKTKNQLNAMKNLNKKLKENN